jgi:hypothetical protein
MIDEGFGNVAKITGRYVFPFEDFSILMTGEDFDGNEASRIAAGGFLILDAIQVGKVFKLAKSAKILTATGTAVGVPRRVFKQYAKDVATEALIDMSVQFFINFIDQSIKNPDKEFDKIAGSAFSKISVKDAIISGMIDYSSLDEVTKTSFDCAAKMFRRMQDGGQMLSLDIGKGTLDCIILVGVRYGFSWLKANGRIQKLANAIADARNYDVVIDKLSKIMTVESVSEVIRKFTEEGVIKGAENVWE